MRRRSRFQRRLFAALAILAVFLLAALIGHLFASAFLGTTYIIDPGPPVGPV